MTEKILDFFKMNDVKYREDLPLSQISPIKIGANADIVAYPNNQEQLVKSVNFLKKNQIKHKILGRMSNTLPPDDKYEGVILRTDNLSRCSIRGRFVDVEAGISLPFIAKTTADSGLSGLEELSGIPGSVGAAIRGNAGAFGREISESVIGVTIYDYISSRIRFLKSPKLDFNYRSSILKNEDVVILSARLCLSHSDKFSANMVIQKCRERRMATQPVGQPSLGSTFKRPAKDLYAAVLIDKCGLKGMTIGGASISEKHAGFIVNRGGASAKDYLELAELAKESVYQKFGIILEREIEDF